MRVAESAVSMGGQARRHIRLRKSRVRLSSCAPDFHETHDETLIQTLAKTLDETTLLISHDTHRRVGDLQGCT